MGLKPTFYDFSLNDGQVVQVTRNFAGLYMLKAYDPAIYEKSQTFNKHEFMTLMPTNAYAVGNIMKKLFGDEKKKADSKQRFKELQQRK